MFGFIEKCFFTVMTFFSCNALKRVSMNHQECRIRRNIIYVNSNESSFYPRLCVPNVVKNINVKVFNVMSRPNETRPRERHETCKFKCRLDASWNVGIMLE